MLVDGIILVTLILFALNGFYRGFLTLVGRLLILVFSILVALLMLGPTAMALNSLPFVSHWAESINEQIILPLVPASASLAEVIDKLHLPVPIEQFLLAEFPAADSPVLDAWPQLSSIIGQYLIKAVTFIILLILVSLVINTLVSLMTSALDRLPVLGGLNRLAGLAVGIFHGALILVITILFAGLLSPYIQPLGEAMQASFLVRQFYSIDWVGLFIGRFLGQI